MRNFFILSVLALLTLVADGQIIVPVCGNLKGLPSQEECKEITERKLILMIPALSEIKIKSLEKKKESGEIARIKKDYAEFVQAIKNGVQEHWNLHTEISIKTQEEVMSLSKKGSKEYIVLSFANPYRQQSGSNLYKFSYSFDGDERVRDEMSAHMYGEKCLIMVPIEKVDAAEDFINNLYLAISLPNEMVDNESIVFGIDFVNHVVKSKLADERYSHLDISKNADKLKTYQLAVNKNEWDTELPEAEAEKIYGYDIEIMEAEAFNEVLNKGKAGIAYGVKMGPYIAIVLSDTKEVVYLSGLGNQMITKMSELYNVKELEKLNKAIIDTRD